MRQLPQRQHSVEIHWGARQDLAENGECLLPQFCLGVPPQLPYARHRERLLAGDDELILRFLFAFLHLLPLIDCIARDDAAPLEEGVFPELCTLDAFGPRVEQVRIRLREIIFKLRQHFDSESPGIRLESFSEYLRPGVDASHACAQACEDPAHREVPFA